jgi:predicted nucleic acid-binding protein
MLDTDVLIERLRGRLGAQEFFESLDGPPVISAITVAQIWAGVRREEESDVTALLTSCEVKDVDREIAMRGGKHRRCLKDRTGTDLFDALIGATAEFYGLHLRTWNVKHFPMLKHVSIPYVRKGKQGSPGSSH